MDTKLVDGLVGVPLRNWMQAGGFAITKYIINYSYFMNSSFALMNMNSWNKLTLAQQDIFMQAMALEEKDAIAANSIDDSSYIQKAKDAGIQFVTFAPDMEKWYLQTAYDAVWAQQAKKFPDATPELKQKLSKP
jgi:TRAP-type C4-dicarboxylate transport system substrate-binding protein